MEIEGSFEDLEKKIVELEEQCEWWKEEKIKWEEQVMKAKGEEGRMKEKHMKWKGKYVEVTKTCDFEEMRWREENGKSREMYWQVEGEKRKLVVDLKAAWSQLRGGDEGKVQLKDEIERLKSSLEERDRKIEALDRQNHSLERDLRGQMGLMEEGRKMILDKAKMEGEKNLKLIRKIQALERDKEEIAAEVSMLRKDNIEESEKIFSVKKALEAEKKMILEKAKMEEEKNLKLCQKIETLERDKEEMVAEVSKLQKEKSEKSEKSFSAKKALEAEKKRLEKVEGNNFELAMKIAEYQREKIAMQDELSKLSQENMEYEAAIKRVVKEKIAFEEEGQKMILKRDEDIKVLYEENITLKAQKKQLEMEKKTLLVLKREGDVKLVHQAPVVGILASPASRNQGKKSSDVSHCEPQKESLDRTAMQLNGHNGQAGSSKKLANEKAVSVSTKRRASDNAQNSHKGIECTPLVASQTVGGSLGNSKRRKIEALGCSIEKQIGTKQHKSGDHSVGKLKWESASKMFNAFTANDELCMRSVCALYRKHRSLGQWKNFPSFSNNGFKTRYETRGMGLGEFLTSGDPEGRMKKSLAEFKRSDPNGIEDCRNIARNHHMELFQIYEKNLDPLFIP